jgi:hypothetical protein
MYNGTRYIDTIDMLNDIKQDFSIVVGAFAGAMEQLDILEGFIENQDLEDVLEVYKEEVL